MVSKWSRRVRVGTRDDDAALIGGLDRLARLEAEMTRLRATRPPGWANLLTVHAGEAAALRETLALEFRRDANGHVFLMRDGAALYHLPPAAA